MRIAYEIFLFNSLGELVRKIDGRVNSLLRNYYLMCYGQFIADDVELKATDGSIFTHRAAGKTFWCNAGDHTYHGVFFVDAPEGDESFGIVIGTSDVAPTPNDYKLNSQFSCWLSDVSLSSVYEEGGSLCLDISRYFLNDNADTDIKEFGLVARAKETDTTNKPVLILRDVISPLSFPLNYSLLLEIKFSF